MDSGYDRVAVLEAQVRKLREKVVENTTSKMELNHLKGVQDREKEEWKESRKFLEDQLSAARQECQSLRREAEDLRNDSRNSGILGETRNGVRGESEEAPPLHRSLSTQSLPVHNSMIDPAHPSPPSSLYNYPLLKPTSTASYIPLANSTLLGHSHISGSNSSISSMRSTGQAYGRSHFVSDRGNYGYSRHRLPADPWTRRSHVPLSSTPRYPSIERDNADLRTKYYHDPHTEGTRRPSDQSTWSSSRQGTQRVSDEAGVDPHELRPLLPSSQGSVPMTASDVELQRSKLKIKQLEKEVFLLDDQLLDKSRSAQGHVEELMLLRTELAQEKASLAIVQQEIRDQAAREVGVVRTMKEQQVKELEGKLRKLKAERIRLERSEAEIMAKLKGSESECKRLHEHAVELERQLDREKEDNARAIGRLRGEVDGGRSHIAKLENSLQQWQARAAKAEEAVTQDTLKATKVSQELREKDKELRKKAEHEAHLQQELASAKMELQQSHASWRELKNELKERLIQSEAAREALLKQLAETNKKLTLNTAQLGSKREAMGELNKCRAEIQRLEGVVSKEIAKRGRMEAEVQRWKRERDKLERQCADEVTRREISETRWQDERRAKEACEADGEELRKEVGRLSEELRHCQHQLQGEVEGKADREKDMEDSLSRLQQELAKRAQQVLEMDRLLQSHQAETTARRLQLERTLSQRQGELKTRTQEVEELTKQCNERQVTIEELRAELVQAKLAQKNLFSGSQAQLLAQDSKVAELQRKLEESESAGAKVSREAKKLQEGLAEVQGTEKVWHDQCQQLQDKVKALTNEKESLHTKHLSEVQRLQELHSSQLASRDQQADTHRQQLQQVTHLDSVRQEELSRCRIQVASLTAELSAERRVAEESKQEVASARAEVNKYKTQVTSLQASVAMLQEMFEQKSMGLQTPHSKTHANGLSSLSSDVDFVLLPNHLKTAPVPTTPTNQAAPTHPLTPSNRSISPVTPPTSERGSIISV